MRPVWQASVIQNRRRHLLTAEMEAVMMEVITARTTEVTTATIVMTAEITETNKI